MTRPTHSPARRPTQDADGVLVLTDGTLFEGELVGRADGRGRHR